VLIPGAAALSYVEASLLLTTGKTYLITSPYILFALSILVGVLGFAGQFHTWVPLWRNQWNDELRAIREQIHSQTRTSWEVTERVGRPVYKLWIETIAPPNVRNHIHYATGLYYMFVTLSVFSFLACVSLAGVSSAWLVFHRIARVWGTAGTIARWVSVASLAGLTVRFDKVARKMVVEVINEGRTLMSMANPEKLINLVRAAADATTKGLPLEQLNDEVRRAIARFKPLHVQDIESIDSPRLIGQFDDEQNRLVQVAYIAVRLRTQEAATEVNGRANLYNGFLQQRIEGVLAERLVERLRAQRVRLQFLGPDPLESANLGPPEAKTVEVVSLDLAIHLGITPVDGKIAVRSRELGIDSVLIRNGRIVGPSFGLGLALEKLLLEAEPRVESVYDGFAGTYLTRQVCKFVTSKTTGTIEVECHDRHTDGDPTFDAFSALPSTAFDCIVVDPLFEDCISYLRLLRAQRNWRYLVVQAGETADFHWGAAVGRLADEMGRRLPGFEELGTEFGAQTFVLEARPSRHMSSDSILEREGPTRRWT
jgi:hypothetical protein